MSWSKEEALTDPAVRNPMTFLSEFRFQLRDIPTEVSIRLYRPLHSGRILVRRSHNLYIPQIAGASAPAETEEPDHEGAALHQSIDELVQQYNAARGQGLTPDASWLKPNPDFC